jgi:serine protease Do
MLALLAGVAAAPMAWSDNPVPAGSQIRAEIADDGYADLVEAVLPAVVNVSVERVAEVEGEAMPPAMRDPEMRRFFERFFGEMPDFPQGQERHRARGEGSGFIIDPNGLVVTNAHVAGGADKVEVTLQDGTKYPATVKGVDEKTDLALLEIKADKALPYVEFGDSSAVRVGEKVLAIGNPFGLGGTVTAGIVSATGREIGQGPYEDFLQIDAPINRGNSGGPTFNLKGQVVGVNTAIFSPSGGSIGIGFAISSNLAKQIVADLTDDGKVERGWLGVNIQQVDKDIATSLGLDKAMGALVAKVEPNSPADAAGLKSRDVILEFADRPIESLRDLTRAVADTDAGKKVQIEVWRDGKKQEVTATIEQQATDRQVAADDQPTSANQPRLGLALAPLSPEMRSRLGMTEQDGGVLIQRVMPDSPAESKGVQPGDVILEVAGHTVDTPQQVLDAVKSAHGAGAKLVLLLLHRNGQPTYEAIPFAAS